MSGKRRRGRAHRLKELKPAPAELRLVQDFVNSADLEAGTDELARPGGLADWLERHSLLAAVEELEAADVKRAIEFRERFRTMLAAGESATREMGAAVDRAARRALLVARFEAGGVLRLQPAAAGFADAVGRLLAMIAVAQRDGLWPRFKICANGACRAAFYDYATNRTGLWCSPRCGSFVRGRDYRRRQRRGFRI